jgi:ATP-binding cassette subfamily F protein 3
VDTAFRFSIVAAEKKPTPLMTINEAAVGYGDTTILDRIELTLAPGDRIGLLGANGMGKSTLVKLIAGQMTPFTGRRDTAQDLRIGYFAQHQLEQLRADETPLDHVQRLAPEAREQRLRDFLGGFGFSGEAAVEPVAPLSGGEKARLVLALIVFGRPNLLLLDEPTNHLDIEMRHALSLALQEYAGALVLVSHDRHLLRVCTDRLLLVEGGSVVPFDGDLEDYRRRVFDRPGSEDAKHEKPSAPHTADGRRARKRREAEHRLQLQPLRTRMRELEARLERLSSQRDAMEATLADPAVYGAPDNERLRVLLRDKARVDRELRAAEEAWLDTGAQLEAVEGASP